MCFKPPKPPPIVEDLALKAQLETSQFDERTRRTALKASRLDDTLAQLGGGIGRRSLLSGGKGGAGFAMPATRSLLT